MGYNRGASSTQELRDSFPYRREYFKKYPGLMFGHIWICSQCGKILMNESDVQVDHIVPLNKSGQNVIENCVATCEKCNKSKSDIYDERVLIGKKAKVREERMYAAKGTILLPLLLVTSLMSGLTGSKSDRKRINGRGKYRGRRKLGKALISLLKLPIKLVFYPVLSGSVVSRLLFFAIYVVVFLFVLRSYTSVLDAWMV